MATYVFSDVHGHAATLDRLLTRVSPSDSDTIFMLGDMIDRGPDSVGVMRLCRELPGCVVLCGNHEDLMLSYFENPDQQQNLADWVINGGGPTAQGLAALPQEECNDYLDWLMGLPLWAYTEVAGKSFVLVHAGLRPLQGCGFDVSTEEGLDGYLNSQRPEDLLWIREDFWERRTGLVDKDGKGAIVIAGHTPTMYLPRMNVTLDAPIAGEDGLPRMVKLGASQETGGVADRWDIDCCAAGGFGRGQILMLRLDDDCEFYEPVQEGE